MPDLEDLMFDTLDAVSRFRVGQRDAVAGALDAGHLLAQAKEIIPHGGWAEWLERVGVKPRTASAWMKLAAMDVTVEEVIENGGINATLRGRPKSATVADLSAKSDLERELAEVEARIADSKREYYAGLSHRNRLLRDISRDEG